ncbi:MAG: FAD-dependent oxidoreductase, partial [Actinobacteria bacterium]|nr:FAD-dependent oxidoreductase [Actinomycetota bacterium]
DIGIYGHPVYEGRTPGVKIGFYNPPDVPRAASRIRSVEEFVAECIPGLAGAEVVDVAAASGVDTCWYDLVADGEFILGAVPGADGLYAGVGWRGTGYKFAPWVGRVLAQLALQQGTVYDIGRFAPARFAAEAALARQSWTGCWAGRPGRPYRWGMDHAELRAVQQPLKDTYRQDPGKAVVTLRARGELDDQGVACSVETGRALAVAGLHPASGGDGSLLCSGDMLLQALVACAGVTLRAVATSLEIDVTGGTVTAEGDLDFRGTLAVAKDAPVGFRAIRLRFDLDTGASAEQVRTLIRLTERYCVVYQTLAHPAELTISA